MKTQIKTLENTELETIHSTFLNAFSDYQVDISYMTLDVIGKRFIKNGYHPELSAGIFENDQLKGFTIAGIGKFNGGRSGFDIMTGVVKEYRGKGLANQMFELIKSKMKDEAIDSFYLEVLQENAPAIKAYTKTGFDKVRGLNCYALKMGKFSPVRPIESYVYIDRTDTSDLDRFRPFLDWEPSWENHFESIRRIPDRVDVFEAKVFDRPVGVLVYYPTLKWILTLAVDPEFRRKGIASALLEYLADALPLYVRDIKALNIDDRDAAMNAFLLESGFEMVTSQYEMRMKL
jgi:ribosomal protein S18 acetylase RimI-like enzyme